METSVHPREGGHSQQQSLYYYWIQFPRAPSRVCSGNVIPPVPKDNSHYIEGVSRYIWMPDGDDNLHLVDLEEPVDENFLASRNGNRNQYWLFTRQNRNNRQVLVNGNANSVRNSFYRGNRPTKVIAHGWGGSGNVNWIPQMVSAFLDRSNVNVIVLDWSSTASGSYTTSVRAVPDVGRHLANFLRFVFNTAGGNWNNVHLVGHSLGAHAVGNAGRAAPSRPVRVTGLDPAGPLWRGNSNALNRNSATYVESIHTDGGSLGIMDPISHADFYPNGGRNRQPGCSDSSCSHERAQPLFSSTVRNNHLNGRRCSNLDQASKNQCTGSTLKMGNSNLNKRGSGLYALSTGASWPY
ncbi:insect intestinal lipase 7 [Danaus plexippus plexippus]|uniref:Insect intestinal lipase 7 n=1 Tax=Danaus plexippus plexippus TaxID=278856 RepID=A0A212FLK4_DANPL|nr:insect intestinal lipase 7 [Danaus plexippus plexippus]